MEFPTWKYQQIQHRRVLMLMLLKETNARNARMQYY